jgi:hypothetical protein
VTREAVRDARRLLRPLRYEIVWMLQALVRANTVAVPPHGRETAGQKVLRRFLRPYRLDVEMYDTGFLARSRHPYVRRDRRYAGRHNLIARLPGAGLGPADGRGLPHCRARLVRLGEGAVTSRVAPAS